MLKLIKLILIIFSLLTSNKVLTLKSDKPDYNISDLDSNSDSDYSSEPVNGGTTFIILLIIHISLGILASYLEKKKKKNQETDVDKIDETHMEEQHANKIDN